MRTRYFALCGLLIWAQPVAALAVSFTVTSTVDAVDANPGDGLCDDGTGACTLRAAVQELNSTPGNSGAITVPPGLYRLTLHGAGEDGAATGDLDLGDPNADPPGSFVLTGAGADLTIIDGDGADRVIQGFADPLTISGVTIRNGVSNIEGAGIATYGRDQFTLTDSHVTTNNGDALCFNSKAQVVRSIIDDNTGGITDDCSEVEFSSISLDHSIFSNNGAGIAGAVVGVSSSLVMNTVGCATVVTEDMGEVALYDSTVTGNGVGVCGGNCSGLVAERSAIIGNGVGADIDMCGGWIRDSTIADNIGDGIIYSGGDPTEVFLENSTVAGNGGAAIKKPFGNDCSYPRVNIHNALIAGGGCTGLCLHSMGYNLIEDVGSCAIDGDTIGNILGVDAGLAATADNGGPTDTKALLISSPAIDAGDPAGCTPTDQRGVARPQGTRCDIGAYESLCASEPRSTGCKGGARAQFQVANSASDAKDRLTWKWSKGDGTLFEDFGDPATATEYALCLHDSSGGTPSLAAAFRVPPNAKWTRSGTSGFKYRDKAAAHDGIASAKLRAGITGKPRLQVKAQGVILPLPAPVSAFQYFDEDPDVTVQLVTSDGVCWTSEFDVSNTSTNNGEHFKAKAP